MKTVFVQALALAATLSTTNAYWKGFNIGSNNPDGSCRTTQDWTNAFNAMKGLDGYFSSARLYASSDCGTLANAVPAAINTGVQILVGVWSSDATHYANEKAALQQAIETYGSGWIVGISVGSEDLYRYSTEPEYNTDPSTLASQIYDVKGMMTSLGVNTQVGHVDTWTAWVNGSNNAVIQACDWVGTDGYPYYQNTDIDDAYNTFWDSVSATRDAVNSVHPGIWVWITETGWPLSGDQMGAAVASQPNAQQYWTSVACAAFQQAHTFWYTLEDANSSPSFGVLESDLSTTTINLGC